MKPAKYILGHEHNTVMHALKETLNGQTKLQCVGKYTDLAALAKALPQTEIFAVVIAHSLWANSAPEITDHFRERQPELRLILFHANDYGYLDPAFHVTQGVVAILEENAPPAEFEAAIKASGYHFNRWLTTDHIWHAFQRGRVSAAAEAIFVKRTMRLERYERKYWVEAVDLLTVREMNVLRLMCEDKTTKEIAKLLFLGERTIEDARHSLMKKTQSHTPAGLVAYAFRKGLVK